MKINGEILPTIEVFSSMMTVPDCIVTNSNKLGTGNGEAKFYISSKEEMHSFYGNEGFEAKCFMLKSDLVAYLLAIKNEYLHPSQNYRKKDDLPTLWEERNRKVQELDDVIFFNIQDQNQIAGPRGYIKSSDIGYKLIRELALPLVSYVYVEKVGSPTAPLFYWKLFVDFDAIWEKQSSPLVFTYGRQLASTLSVVEPVSEPQTEEQKSVAQEVRRAREGQGKYREKLLEQCRFCPITMIGDERLLIASHIKPWAASTDEEKIDPYNGYILSPMYDKLFDRGFITFTPDRKVILSEFISPYTWKQIGIKDRHFYSALPMDDKRIKYLEFHHSSVFKGSYEE